MTYERHFLSASWPDMSAEDHQALRDSIAASGLREAIVLLNGEVLDGWQRYTACIAEGIEPRFEDFRGEDGDEAADFIRDKHTRRPLTLTQRLAAVLQMSRYKPAHRPNKSANSADLPKQSERSIPEIAASVGASTRSASSVKAALDNGAPELVKAVTAGAVSAHRAEEISKLPKDEQAAALSAPKAPRFRGKPMKGPKADLIRAEMKAAAHRSKAEESQARVAELEQHAAGLSQQLAEALQTQAAAEADNAGMAKVFEANDQLAVAVAEAKKYRDLAAGLQQRINSMMTEIAELKRSVKQWQKKAGQTA